ncbi:MAG: hypothetical protein K8U57_07410 [Planctomycetes bacterium]|nr:hypothetical protein [Planctomycetota bacterium]
MLKHFAIMGSVGLVVTLGVLLLRGQLSFGLTQGFPPASAEGKARRAADTFLTAMRGRNPDRLNDLVDVPWWGMDFDGREYDGVVSQWGPLSNGLVAWHAAMHASPDRARYLERMKVVWARPWKEVGFRPGEAAVLQKVLFDDGCCVAAGLSADDPCLSFIFVRFHDGNAKIVGVIPAR